jgi:hypothetical protein
MSISVPNRFVTIWSVFPPALLLRPLGCNHITNKSHDRVRHLLSPLLPSARDSLLSSVVRQGLLKLFPEHITHSVHLLQRFFQNSNGWEVMRLDSEIHLWFIRMRHTVATEISLWLPHNDMSQGVPNSVICVMCREFTRRRDADDLHCRE